MTAIKPAKIRKASWSYEDLAWKIILPDHIPAMHTLRYLAKLVNDSGRCYVAQTTIAAVCGGLSRSAVYKSLQYLYDLGLVTLVKKGYGNQHTKDNVSSTYQLNLKVMQKLVAAQGIYDSSDNGSRLLSGWELAAQVKLLGSLTERSR